MSFSSMTALTSLTLKRCLVDAPFLKSLLTLSNLQVLALGVEGLNGDGELDDAIIKNFLEAAPVAFPQLSKLDLSGSIPDSGGVGSLLPVFEKLPLVELKLGAFEGFDEEQLARAKALPFVDAVIRAPEVQEQYGTWAAHPSRSMLRELQVVRDRHYDDGDDDDDVWIIDNLDAIMSPLRTAAPHLTKLTLSGGDLAGDSIYPITGFTQLRALTIEENDKDTLAWIDDEAISMLSSLTSLVSLTLSQVIEVTGEDGSMEDLAAGLVHLTALRFWGESSADACVAAQEAFVKAPGPVRSNFKIAYNPELAHGS